MSFHESVPMRLRRAYLTVHRAAQAHFAQFGVTADQYVLLSLLAEQDGITQKELAERMCSDGNTITAMVRLLETKKLVRRRRCDADGRARHELVVTNVTIAGDDAPIVGRGVIVHAGTDDFATQPTGGAGARIGYGVIGIRNPN